MSVIFLILTLLLWRQVHGIYKCSKSSWNDLHSLFGVVWGEIFVYQAVTQFLNLGRWEPGYCRAKALCQQETVQE